MATYIGVLAASCTTISYFPQLKKFWDTGEAGDLSLGMFSILVVGLSLWVVYGVLQSDVVVMTANAISVVLLCGFLYFKVRQIFRGARKDQPVG